jgi:hypothetical protein
MSLEKWALVIATLALFFDALIFAWLVFTWFYEGHHKKCEVEVACSHCGHQESHKCSADPRNKVGA